MKEKILTLLIILNLIISGIIIGSPIEETSNPIIIATLILFVAYIIISKNKIKIIRSKIDIFVLLLGASTLIPLIFNTAVSITSEIDYIFKYISAIMIYICIREHCNTYPKTRKYIINTIVSLSLVLIVLGIDNMYSKTFTSVLELINIKIKEIEPNRLSSIFCYANALAIVIGISIILNNSNYIKEQNKNKKAMYGVITTFLMAGLFLTYSRLAMLIILIFVIVNIILLKNKQQQLDLIKLFIIAIISAYIYNSIFFTLINNRNYILFWLVTIILNLINFVMIYNLIGIEKKLENIRIGKLLIIALIILVIIIVLAISITGNLDLFKKGRKEYEIQLHTITPDKEYSMEFQFGEIQINKEIENIKIQVVEMDKYDDEIKITEIPEKDFIDNGKINIKTQDTTDKMKIIFTQINPECKIIIKKLNVNGINITLDYKLIPDKIEHRIINTMLTKKGASERIVFIEDGLKIIKDNWLFGKGANAWEYEQYNYQQYYYSATQMHSYIIQVGIEYGIIAVISLIAIITLSIYQYIKSKSKTDAMQISIFISILLLISHSTIDFEMTYLYVLQLFFVLIAMLFSFEKQEIEEEKTKLPKIIISIIILIFGTLYITLEPYYNSSLKIDKIKELTQDLYKTGANKQEIDKEIIKNYKEYFSLEKHTTVYADMYYNYAHVIQRNLTEENITQTAEELDKLYDIIKNIKPKYQAELITEKYRESKLVADKIKYSKIKSEELTKVQYKYYKIVVDEYEEARKIIEKDYKLCRISKEESNRYTEKLENMYNGALEELNGLNIKEQ